MEFTTESVEVQEIAGGALILYLAAAPVVASWYGKRVTKLLCFGA